VVTQNLPSEIKLISKESERDTVIHLLMRSKILDGEETRTILLNGCQTRGHRAGHVT
jgi:hypothetical protein